MKLKRRWATATRRRRQRRERAKPPPLPPGWTVAPPDFIGVGVQRSGTSWWYNLIERHPAVRERRPKELHFFDAGRARKFSDSDAELYARFFPRPVGQITGEWTPRYSFDEWTPPLLARCAPDSRLLILLRDPVERFRSHVGGVELLGLKLTSARREEAIARGRYFVQLERLLKIFPRECLLILQSEKCVLDPLSQIRRTYQFLGLDGFEPRVSFRPNSSGAHKPTLDSDDHSSLVRRLEEDVASLAIRFQEIDLSLWPNFRHLRNR